MKTSAVSFGRAIRVNASIPVAKKIADIANNSGKVSENVTEAGKERALMAKEVFADACLPDGKARVISFAPDEVYIYSGEEAAVAAEILGKTKNKIEQEKKLADMLPDRLMRSSRKSQNVGKHYCLDAFAKQKVRSLAENGVKNPRMSVLQADVESVGVDGIGKCDKIKSVTYATKLGEEVKISKYGIDCFV